MKRFGEKLRALRTRQKVTIRTLSQAISISNSYVTMIETGENKPSLDIAFRIARFFQVSLDSMADDEVEII
jgi:5-methylcytosine-specific restriction protein A